MRFKRRRGGTFTISAGDKTTKPIPYNAGLRGIKWASWRARLPIKIRKP